MRAEKRALTQAHTYIYSTYLVAGPPRNHFRQLRHNKEGDDHDDPMRPYLCFPHFAWMGLGCCGRGDGYFGWG